MAYRQRDEKGATVLEYAIRNCRQHGRCLSFYEHNGSLLHETRYVDGREHGLSRQYDEKGRLVGTYRMNHGTGVDLWYLTLPPYSLQEERYYTDGKLDGFERWWRDKRRVWQEGHFKGNQKHGIFRDWQWDRPNLRRGFLSIS